MTVPHKVFGNFLILVRTDASNSVYEHLNEDNNIGQSEVCEKGRSYSFAGICGYVSCFVDLILAD